ncbi:MAG: hypothetical protein RR162_04750 [Oscillospiraceae bacterium]
MKGFEENKKGSKYKDIPTDQLIAELVSRDNVMSIDLSEREPYGPKFSIICDCPYGHEKRLSGGHIVIVGPYLWEEV